MNRRRTRVCRLAVCGLALAGALVPAAIRGQEKSAAAFDEWRLLEPTDEMVAYRTQLRQGAFDDATRKFLTTVALPHLGLPKNRPTIDRIRRRMRDVLCGEQGVDPKVAAAVMEEISKFMIAVARDPKADVTHRVNATLFVGELRGPGAKPWAPAAAPLTAALADDGLPPAVRIAAAAGLARQVEADPVARAADVGPALVKLVGAPLEGVDPVAADWLRARALTMLARMGSGAPAGAVAAAAGLLRDAARPIDLRVRAAATVGGCVKAAEDTDVAAAVAAIRELATAALQGTKADFERREFAELLAGGDAAAAEFRQAPGPDLEGDQAATGPTQAYRRDAWRLATLADALGPVAGAGGLAAVAGASAADVTALAGALRAGATTLDAQPDATSLESAIEGLAAVGTPAAPGAATGEPAPQPAAPQPQGVDGVPFGDG